MSWREDPRTAVASRLFLWRRTEFSGSDGDLVLLFWADAHSEFSLVEQSEEMLAGVPGTVFALLGQKLPMENSFLGARVIQDSDGIETLLAWADFVITRLLAETDPLRLLCLANTVKKDEL